MTSPLSASLPLRATFAAVAVLVAAIAVLVILIGAQANRTLAERTLAALEAEVAEAQAIFTRDGLEALRVHLNRNASGRQLTRYALALGAGVTASGSLGATEPSLSGIADGSVFSVRDLATGTTNLFVGRRAIIPLADGRSATLLLAHDIEDQRRLARTIQLITLAGLGLIALAALALGLLARRALLARVGAITETSRAIMTGDLSRRIVRDGSGDEIDQLSDSLNAMLARIEDLMAALRDVSDNIAHDLRTPLNRLRITAEDALRPEHGVAVKTDALGRIIDEADSLIKTFNALLMIARLEQGVGAETMEMIDLRQLVDDTVELYDPVADDARLKIAARYDHASDHTVLANRQLLSQAIANLVDNAIKYTPAGSTAHTADVVVGLFKAARHVEISVEDSGAGIAPEDRERALKRFVRLEQSRSLPGTGLGLSLVAAIARLHHGELRLEDNAPGLRAVLVLPR